jgi:serine/threonine protein kinase
MWMSITSIGGPPPALAKHSASLVGTKIWYYGGLFKNTVTVSNDVYTYDIPSNTWAGPLTTIDPPSRGRAGHTMTQVGTKLHLLGGATFDEKKQEVILDDMYEFDTTTLKWTMQSKAPVARHGHVAAALEGKLYAWGGRSPGGEYSSAVSVYDFAVRDWTEALNLTGFVPTPRQWAAGAPVQGRHLLVIGGKRDALQNDVYLLDVNAETWCKYSLPCLLDHRMSAAIQVVENPKSGILTIYIFGGLQLNAETMDTTIYSDQFVTFQLHNKYIQQNAKTQIWTAIRSHSIDGHGVALPSSASSARFNFVSKVAQPTGTQVAKVESSSALCNLQKSLASESRFGETWLGEHARTRLAFAVKVMKKPVQRDIAEEWKQLSKAVETAQKCKSPFLTTYMGIMDQPATESFWILSEYCKYGSVKDFVAAGNKLREAQIQFLASVMISALQSLHAAGLVHGNLRASNVLLTDGLEFKCCDFALSTALEALLKPTSTWNSWDAPEVLLGGAFTPKSDVFALGVTLIEMAEYAPPHKALNTKKRWSAQMEDFVHKAITESEKLRPDLDTLANHPWIKTAKASEKLQLDLADLMKKGFAKEAKKRSATVSNVPPTSSSATPSAVVGSSTSSAPSSTGSNSAATAVTSSASATGSSSAAVSLSSGGNPGSGRIPPREKKSSPDSLPIQSATNTNGEEPSAADEVVVLKARNAVLRKKLRLLKKAYEELSQENTKLKEQLDTTHSMATGNTSDAAEDSNESSPPLIDASPLERSPSGSSIKIKRSGKSVKDKDRSSRKSLRVTDGTPSPMKEE